MFELREKKYVFYASTANRRDATGQLKYIFYLLRKGALSRNALFFRLVSGIQKKPILGSNICVKHDKRYENSSNTRTVPCYNSMPTRRSDGTHTPFRDFT